ncbi:Scr1 family TA system antitoxin-like transcriptional regulator [Streptomyces sp. NPDC003077]|uniref:Scr1 family TA system antitoxin-like transcriptional regulator n=1 Tax=Streptomyces sp. NPDC003077 TaxID=3154443 RepID=UPI00339E4CD8
MPPRKHPTERQRRLGLELRKLREKAGVSGDQAADILDADRTRISNIEAGRLDVPRNRLYKLLRHYECQSGALFDGIMDMAQESGKGWWDDFRDSAEPVARDLAEMESRCQRLWMHEPLFIPGMLQTEDYARAVMRDADGDHEKDDRFVEFRMARQRVIREEADIEYRAIIHQAALHTPIGGPAVMRKQLLRLIEVARQPNVSVQIFPFEAGGYSAYSRSFVLIGSAVPSLGTVYLEHPVQSLFVREEGAISDYARMFEKLSGLALRPIDPESRPESHTSRDSLGLIQHVMYTL